MSIPAIVGTYAILAILLLSSTQLAHAQNEPQSTVQSPDRMDQATLRDLARLLVAYEVQTTHLVALETDQDAHRTLIEFSRDARPDNLGYQWTASRIAIGTGAKNDEFEKQALAAFGAGEDELWDVQGDVIRFASAVRAKESCVLCHRLVQNNARVKPGDILGVIVLRMSPRKAAP